MKRLGVLQTRQLTRFPLDWILGQLIHPDWMPVDVPDIYNNRHSVFLYYKIPGDP